MNIYFGLGSNLGNRLQNLRDAVEKLKSFGEISKKSDVFETKAWGVVEQPDFLNACIKIKTHLKIEPLEILKIIKNFENEIGRVKNIRWGARKIDIDILLIDNIIYHSPELDIPHINLHERLFVLVPLAQILPPEWKHPYNKSNIAEIIEKIRVSSSHEPLRITAL